MSEGNARVEERRRLLGSMVDEVLNGKNWEAATRFFAPDILVHHPTSAEPIRGIDGFETLLRTAYAGFPDWRFSIDVLLVDGDHAAARATTTGTHTGTFVGFPPTGQRFEVTELAVFRYDGDVVAEAWIVPDLMRQMQQLGLMPEGPPPKPMLVMMRLMQRFGRHQKKRSA